MGGEPCTSSRDAGRARLGQGEALEAVQLRVAHVLVRGQRDALRVLRAFLVLRALLLASFFLPLTGLVLAAGLSLGSSSAGAAAPSSGFAIDEVGMRVASGSGVETATGIAGRAEGFSACAVCVVWLTVEA